MSAIDPPELTVECLRSFYLYDPQTGVFTRRIARRGYSKGTVAGSVGLRGYILITTAGKCCRAHRLAWLYVHGEWPADEIDHINGDHADNRLANLRVVSRAENSRNLPVPHNNQSGVRGVHLDGWTGKWRAEIHNDSKRVHLGRFSNKNDAVAARKRAEAEYGYHPNHGRAA